MTRTKENKDAVNKAIINMQEALLGVADLEEGILIKIKDHLDQLLNSVYSQVKEFQKVAAMDAMIVESPITQADGALVTGLESVASELNDKNIEILKLQNLLAGLGVDVPPGSTQSVEMLRQQLEELNKRNKLIREIHQQLLRTPMITGRITKGVTLKEVKLLLEKLNEQILSLNKINYDFKKQIKPQSDLNKKQDTSNDPNANRPGSKRF